MTEYKYRLVQYHTDAGIYCAMVRTTVKGSKPTLMAVWVDSPLRLKKLHLDEENYMTKSWPDKEDKRRGLNAVKMMLDAGKRLGITIAATTFLKEARKGITSASK